VRFAPSRIVRTGRRRLAAAAAVLATLSTLVLAPHSQAATRRFVPFRIGGQPIRAVTLTDIRQFAALSIPDMTRIKSDGFNMVTIYAYKFMLTPTANDIIDGPWTEPDASLGAAIDAAHAAGLQVQLVPTVWVGLTGAGAFYWRGAIHPTDHNAWFDSYRFMLDHYADLAQSHHVELFGIGSEMISLENEVAQWRHTISSTRAHYAGPVTYFTVYATVDRIQWWKYVDYPGVSPYMSLSTTPVPSYAEIVNAWKTVHLPYLRKIEAYVGRPLMVSEIGYASSVGAATHPEDGGVGTPDETVQATLYRAFLDTVMADKALDGVSFYRWSATELGPLDHGFSPKGKAVECLLAMRWARSGTSASECSPLGRVAV
jgi:hypothetical protein